MSTEELPVIDWQACQKLAGNNHELAHELLISLRKNLSEELPGLNQLYEKNDICSLKNKIHRLHGAVSYCGVPRLKNLFRTLESQIKNNIMTDLPSLLKQLDVEVKLLIDNIPPKNLNV